MKYVEFLNSLIKQEVARRERIVLFGQNINAGSCLAGLTRGLKVSPLGKIINTTNSENSLCGLGFGLMLGGVPAVFFMKQLDFLSLGVEHLVDTYNIIRNIGHQLKDGSFTIVATVVDSGYEGPQSASNNFSDICSMARVRGLTITNRIDAETIIPAELVAPGFRIIALSQRLSREEILHPGQALYVNSEHTVFQYAEGNDATIASFNFSFPQAGKLLRELSQANIHSALFNVNSPTATDWSRVVGHAQESGKLILIDDSKSRNLALDALAVDVVKTAPIKKLVVLKRHLGEDWLHPVSDEMTIDTKGVLEELSS